MPNWRRIDPEAAARIHATDAQRIQRALEVFRLVRPHHQRLAARAASARRACRTACSSWCWRRATARVLHERIELRFDAMLAAGFLDEVRRLRAMPELQAHPRPLDLPALRAVGYRQAWEHLDGAFDAARVPRPRHLRHAPARQAPADLAARANWMRAGSTR